MKDKEKESVEKMVAAFLKLDQSTRDEEVCRLEGMAFMKEKHDRQQAVC